MIKIFKRQKIEDAEEINEMIVDSNLPDVRKIEIPDLKQYLVNGYKEIREVKKQNEELQNKLDENYKFEQLYNGALVTLKEFQDRDIENKEKINNLDKKIETKNEEIRQLNDIINTYRIREKEINDMEDKLKATIEENQKEAEKQIKDNLIKTILDIKGNISKNRLCDLIENKNLLEKENKE